MLVSFENPPGFGKQNSAYVYLMLPWIRPSSFMHSRYSLATSPITRQYASTSVVNGGPCLSPFSSSAMDSENIVAIASGIGVTPAVSLIKHYSCTSHWINLIWVCRFLQNLEFVSNGHILIYYTGKRQLTAVHHEDLPANVCLFNGQPDLEKSISAVIYSISSGQGLVEDLFMCSFIVSKVTTETCTKLMLEKALSVTRLTSSLSTLLMHLMKAAPHNLFQLQALMALCWCWRFCWALSVMIL